MNTPVIAFVSFVLGAATSTLVDQVDQKALREKLRPLAKNTLKTGIAVGRELRRKVTRLAEDLNDLVEEVMVEQAEEKAGGAGSVDPGDKRSGPESKPSAP